MANSRISTEEFIKIISTPSKEMSTSDVGKVRSYLEGAIKENLALNDTVDDKGNTALMLAAKNGHTNIVKWMANILKTKDTDFDAVNSEHMSAFALAHYNGHFETESVIPTKVKIIDQGRESTGYAAYAAPSTIQTPGSSLTTAVKDRDHKAVEAYIEKNATAKDPRTFYVYALALKQALEQDHPSKKIAKILCAPVATKWLFSLKDTNNELFNILIKASPKEVVFRDEFLKALLKMPEAEQQKAFKQIIEDDQSALHKMFAAGKDSGRWKKLEDKYKEIISKELMFALKYLKVIKDEHPHFEEDMKRIHELFTKGAKLSTSDDPNVFVGLLLWLDKINVSKMTPEICEHLQLFKTQLLTSARVVGRDARWGMLQQAFDESQPDKKKDTTPFGMVVWTGDPHYKKDRVGELYELFLETKKLMQMSSPTLFSGTSASKSAGAISTPAGLKKPPEHKH